MVDKPMAGKRFKFEYEINYCNINGTASNRWQWTFLPQKLKKTSRFNKKCYDPLCTASILGILLETRSGSGHQKFSFIKALILRRILNIFKSALTDLVWMKCILFMIIVSFYFRSFYIYGSTCRFVTDKTILGFYQESAKHKRIDKCITM